jgi:hypothetical protein
MTPPTKRVHQNSTVAAQVTRLAAGFSPMGSRLRDRNEQDAGNRDYDDGNESP